MNALMKALRGDHKADHDQKHLPAAYNNGGQEQQGPNPPTVDMLHNIKLYHPLFYYNLGPDLKISYQFLE